MYAKPKFLHIAGAYETRDDKWNVWLGICFLHSKGILGLFPYGVSQVKFIAESTMSTCKICTTFLDMLALVWLNAGSSRL